MSKRLSTFHTHGSLPIQMSWGTMRTTLKIQCLIKSSLKRSKRSRKWSKNASKPRISAEGRIQILSSALITILWVNYKKSWSRELSSKRANKRRLVRTPKLTLNFAVPRSWSSKNRKSHPLLRRESLKESQSHHPWSRRHLSQRKNLQKKKWKNYLLKLNVKKRSQIKLASQILKSWCCLSQSAKIS